MPFEIKGSELLTGKLNLRLTKAEKKALQEDADLAGLKMSELVRRRYFGRPIITNSDLVIVRELRRLGSILIDRNEQDSEAFLQLRAVLEKVCERDSEGH